MANHKSAAKRARQSVKKNARNSDAMGSFRTAEKKLRAALASNDKSGVADLLNTYMSKITKAATAGVVHAKTAARKVSRLAASVHASK